MKILLRLFFLCLPFALNAQSIHYKIEGVVKEGGDAKYAYLATPLDGKLFKVVPIINNTFTFSGTDSIGGLYVPTCLFIDSRGNITKEELKSKITQMVWYMGRSRLKRILLEDVKFRIENKEIINAAKIIEGGKLTREWDEKNECVSKGDRSLIDFVQKHPDSPVSLIAVLEIAKFWKLPVKEKITNKWGTPNELFVLLSKDSQNSSMGLSIKQLIAEGDKL